MFSYDFLYDRIPGTAQANLSVQAERATDAITGNQKIYNV